MSCNHRFALLFSFSSFLLVLLFLAREIFFTSASKKARANTNPSKTKKHAATRARSRRRLHPPRCRPRVAFTLARVRERRRRRATKRRRDFPRTTTRPIGKEEHRTTERLSEQDETVLHAHRGRFTVAAFDAQRRGEWRAGDFTPPGDDFERQTRRF